MWLHFCTYNHDPIGRSTLADMMAWFEAGLLDAGHKVTCSDRHVEAGAINLLWECFHPGMGTQIRQTGVRYGVIATEIPDGNAFNWREEPRWKERFEAFLDVASGASFIWTTVESTVPFYARFGPTAYLEFGFSERLIPPYIDQVPELDFSFFGLPTPYRVAAIERLRKHARVAWPDRVLSPGDVGKLIGRTRVGLAFKQSERWPIPSATRLGRLMMARRGIAAERTECSTRQSEIVGLAPPQQDFVDFALETLHSNWQRHAEKVFTEYRDQLPMGRIMEGVLQHTLDHGGVRDGRRKPIAVSSHTLPPMLVMTRGEWNVVSWHGKYYALARSCGPVDVRDGIAALKARHGKGSAYCAGTLRGLQMRILLHDGWQRIVTCLRRRNYRAFLGVR